jgi:hypothetical protein
MIDTDDRKDQLCTECGVGRYQETSIHDDWDGVLHCTNKKCNHEVRRYKSDDNPQPKVYEEVKLSPIAKEILDATRFEVNAECHAPWIAAAVLRAVAKQSTFADVAVNKTIEVVSVDTLLAIANELEAQ